MEIAQIITFYLVDKEPVFLARHGFMGFPPIGTLVSLKKNDVINEHLEDYLNGITEGIGIPSMPPDNEWEKEAQKIREGTHVKVEIYRYQIKEDETRAYVKFHVGYL